MTTFINLNKNIEVEPHELDDNLTESIKKKLNVASCSKDIGYILEVSSINSIDSLPLVRGSNPTFSVNYKAKILKPEKGKRLKCKINMIFSQGIFLNFGPLKILVRITSEDTNIKLDISKKCFKIISQEKVKDYYSFFGIENNSTIEDIKKKVKSYKSEHSKNKKLLEIIDKGSEILTDKTKRKNYDKTLKEDKLEELIISENVKEYHVEDELEVEITQIKYEKHNFSCIAKLID